MKPMKYECGRKPPRTERTGQPMMKCKCTPRAIAWVDNRNVNHFPPLKRGCVFMVLMIAVVTTGAAAQKPGQSPPDHDVRQGGDTTNKTIPPAAAWEQGFPIPAGARRNEALGGATSIAPGRNYSVRVYDIDSGIETMIDFYGHHLPAAKRTSEGRETRFSTPEGHVKITRLDKGTRITFVIGPR